MSLIVTAPFRCWASAIDSVPDPVFAQRMMGDGVAIQPLDDTIVAPFDGEVTTLHDSAHATALRSTEGVELLIHIGLDTVVLKGRGVTPLVAPGQSEIGRASARERAWQNRDVSGVAVAIKIT